MFSKFEHPRLNNDPNTIYFFQIYLEMSSKEHIRQVYNVVDFVGHLGGVFYLVFIVCALLFTPIAEHSFIINTIQNLFYVKNYSGSAKGKGKNT